MFALLIILAMHWSHGAGGVVLWVQPPHVAVGVGLIHWHLIHWLNFR